MKRRPFSEREIDRMLGGEPVGGEAGDRVAAFAREMRTGFAQPPTELVAARHLRAITTASHIERSERLAPRRGFAGSISRVAAAAAAVFLAVAGAIGAGSLPGAGDATRDGVFRALSHVGNSQDDGTPGALDPESNSSDNAKVVLGVVLQRDSFSSGCEFGHAVAAAASGTTKPECPEDEGEVTTEQGPPEDNPGQGDVHGNANGPPAEFPGQGGAKGQQEEFPGQGNATGHQQETSGQARGHGEHPGQGQGKGQGGQSSSTG
ncbi:MAG: hypothetical protein ACRDH6_07070 [Actinomycetota bacterium]